MIAMHLGEGKLPCKIRIETEWTRNTEDKRLQLKILIDLRRKDEITENQIDILRIMMSDTNKAGNLYIKGCFKTTKARLFAHLSDMVPDTEDSRKFYCKLWID